MELKQIFAIVRHRAWMLVLGLVLGAGIAFLVSWYQTPIYQASTQVIVIRAPQEVNSDYYYISDQQLTDTYVQLLGTRTVAESVSERLGFPVSSGQIRVQKSSTYTQIITITVQDTDPAQAAAIANTVVEVLIETNENLQASRFTSAEESLRIQVTQIETQMETLQEQIDQASAQGVQEQLAQVETQMASLQSEIAVLQGEIAALGRGGDQTLLSQKQAQLEQNQSILSLYQDVYSNLIVVGSPSSGDAASNVTRLQRTMELYQQIYLQLLNSLENVRLAKLQSTPNVSQVDTALVPSSPISPDPVRSGFLGAAVGLLLAGGVVFLIEYLDDTLKTPEEIEQRLGLSTIGFIAEMPHQDADQMGLYVARKPRSPIAEAFRSLRTNLEFAGVDKPMEVILVTSAGPGEGKSTIAANLAGIIAQGGQRVILLDADLRRPSIHRFFKIPNRLGLTNLFRDHLEVKDVIRVSKDVKGFFLITAGALPPNPAELLASEKMDLILGDLLEMADIVVIDSPPSLMADVQVLSARVDCVLLVIQPGVTHRDAAVATMEQFRRAGAKVVGAVLNRIPRHRSYAYGGYSYQSSYYYASEPKAKPTKPVVQPARQNSASPVSADRAELVSRMVEKQEPSVTPAPTSTESGEPVPEAVWPSRPLAIKKPPES